jgi:hypothetical protein
MPKPPRLQNFLNYNEFANLCISQGLTFPNGVPSTNANRAKVKVKKKNKVNVNVTLRVVVYRQSVRLGVKPLENHDQKFFN